MRQGRQILRIALLSSVIAAAWVGCGGEDGGAGGAGGKGGGSESPANGPAGPSNTTGVVLECDEVFAAFFSEECNACLIENCCERVIECANTTNCVACTAADEPCDSYALDVNEDVVACRKKNCLAPCLGAPPWECSPPVEAPSGGSCVPVGGEVECNPLTNEPCDTAGGEACDHAGDGVFQCFPGPNTKKTCAFCGEQDGFCEPGHVCTENLCAKLCCDDGDCAPGRCEIGGFGALQLGLCVPNGGAGGGGGAGEGGGGGGAGGSAGMGGAGEN